MLYEVITNVVINYRGNAAAATETVGMVEEAGGYGLAVQANIAEVADRQRLIDETLQEFNRVDLLVNNAGMAPRQRLDILETSESYNFV